MDGERAARLLSRVSASEEERRLTIDLHWLASCYISFCAHSLAALQERKGLNDGCEDCKKVSNREGNNLREEVQPRVVEIKRCAGTKYRRSALLPHAEPDRHSPVLSRSTSPAAERATTTAGHHELQQPQQQRLLHAWSACRAHAMPRA